jgi:hypothetical protein
MVITRPKHLTTRWGHVRRSRRPADPRQRVDARRTVCTRGALLGKEATADRDGSEVAARVKGGNKHGVARTLTSSHILH